MTKYIIPLIISISCYGQVNKRTDCLVFPESCRPIDTTKRPLIIIDMSENRHPSQPLVVVNGWPFEKDIDDLDINKIISVTVLRDSSATRIYGVRGMNGVIVINTSQTCFGTMSGKMRRRERKNIRHARRATLRP